MNINDLYSVKIDRQSQLILVAHDKGRSVFPFRVMKASSSQPVEVIKELFFNFIWAKDENRYLRKKLIP